MPAPAAQQRAPVFGVRTWIFTGLAISACLLAITARSFWIDECYTARLAQQPTLQAMWHLLREIKGSDPQMPLYIVWIWSCEKFTGASEPALRAVNVLWFAPALVALAAAFAGNRRLQGAILLAIICSPFAWYYLNEARSYTMQFSTSLILFAAVAHWWRSENAPTSAEHGWVLGFATALVCLCGSSLLAMVLAATPILLALVVLPRKRLASLVKKFWPVWAATLVALVLLGFYYLWTLHTGDRGTDVATTDWKNLAFIGYELGGFAGLGPGRLEIRSGDVHVFKAHAFGLIIYGILVTSLAGLAILELRQRLGVKKLAAMIIAAALPAGLLLAASAVSHFRILGRHYSALLPVVVFLLGLGVASAWRRSAMGRVFVLLFFTFYLGSAVELRLAARHEKDNYRAAAIVARAALAAGKSVWWNADPNAAIYYRVPLAKTGPAENGSALWVIHSTAESLAGGQPPNMIVASRRDVYDERGALTDYLAREHFHTATNFMAFTIWERGAD